VLLRCNSAGDLYPLASPSPLAFVVTAPSVDLWHLRLGHPGRQIFVRLYLSLNSVVPSLCLTLVKPVSLVNMFIFRLQRQTLSVMSLFRSYMPMSGHLLCLVVQGLNITLF